MTEGRVLSLFTTPAMSQAMTEHEAIEAIAGEGLAGDRYQLKTGTYSKKIEPGRQVTLVAEESLAALAADHGIDIAPIQCRRNVLTRGIALPPLVGQEITVGPVRLKVHRLNQPCLYFEKLLDKPGVFEHWWDRSGINCEILTGGPIRVGDPIQVCDT
ncbi:MAG: MOSC domain-containing protein [Alphaproteobacteria bacterium]|nr:MOSC domain-containing protein [Alphaproteobacteria bacterium]